jgi:hypothetical protein
MYTYPKNIFPDELCILNKFICDTCKQVTLNFVTDECGHSFGKFCCARKILSELKCPITGLELTRPLQDRQALAFHTLMTRDVRCPFALRCDWRGKFEELDFHLDNDCKENNACINTACMEHSACEKKLFSLVHFEGNKISENGQREAWTSTNSRISNKISQNFSLKNIISRFTRTFVWLAIYILLILALTHAYQVDYQKLDIKSIQNLFEIKNIAKIGKNFGLNNVLKFDKDLKGATISVVDNRAKYESEGRLILLNTSIMDSPKFTFKILEKKSQDFSIGVCSKSEAKKSNYYFEKNSDVKMDFYLFRNYVTNPHVASSYKISQNPRGRILLN